MQLTVKILPKKIDGKRAKFWKYFLTLNLCALDAMIMQKLKNLYKNYNFILKKYRFCKSCEKILEILRNCKITATKIFCK